MSVYSELCWFMLFSSEWFEAIKESFFTIKEHALVVDEDIKKQTKTKSQFHGLERCFCFSC